MTDILKVSSSRANTQNPLPDAAYNLGKRLNGIFDLYKKLKTQGKISQEKFDQIIRLKETLSHAITEMGKANSNQSLRPIFSDLFLMLAAIGEAIGKGQKTISYDSKTAPLTIDDAFKALNDVVLVVRSGANPDDVLSSYKMGGFSQLPKDFSPQARGDSYKSSTDYPERLTELTGGAIPEDNTNTDSSTNYPGRLTELTEPKSQTASANEFNPNIKKYASIEDLPTTAYGQKVTWRKATPDEASMTGLPTINGVAYIPIIDVSSRL